MGRTRLVVSLLIVNTVLALTALGWLIWITTSPRYWFAGAYAAQGPQGEKGPRGDASPPGPPGPVGPDAADAIDSLQPDIDDLVSRVDDLETDLSDLQDETGTSTFESDFEDVQQTVSNLCDALSQYDGALYDVHSAAC